MNIFLNSCTYVKSWTFFKFMINLQIFEHFLKSRIFYEFVNILYYLQTFFKIMNIFFTIFLNRRTFLEWTNIAMKNGGIIFKIHEHFFWFNGHFLKLKKWTFFWKHNQFWKSEHYLKHKDFFKGEQFFNPEKHEKLLETIKNKILTIFLKFWINFEKLNEILKTCKFLRI